MRLALALFLFAAPIKVPLSPQFKVWLNSKPLKVRAPALRLAGAFNCKDGIREASCVCPSTGLLLSGSIDFVLSSAGQTTFDAPWVTAETGIACSVSGLLQARMSYTLDPGNGFTVYADTGQPWVGTLQVACVGAQPQ